MVDGSLNLIKVIELEMLPRNVQAGESIPRFFGAENVQDMGF